MAAPLALLLSRFSLRTIPDASFLKFHLQRRHFKVVWSQAGFRWLILGPFRISISSCWVHECMFIHSSLACLAFLPFSTQLWCFCRSPPPSLHSFSLLTPSMEELLYEGKELLLVYSQRKTYSHCVKTVFGANVFLSCVWPFFWQLLFSVELFLWS